MIARRRILARQHDIAMRQRIGRHHRFAVIVKGPPTQRTGPNARLCLRQRHGLAHVDPPGMGVSVRDPPRALGRVQSAAGAGIDRSFGSMRRGQARLDVGAGAEAGIEQPHRPQPVQRRCIGARPLRLEDDLPIPCDAQPAQILDDRRHMFGPAASPVYILDAQPHRPSGRARQVHRHQRGPAMADMQSTGGARREAGHHMLWCDGPCHTGP